jgi:DNA-directed RNA polymerase specialized sigma24 family protein
VSPITCEVAVRRASDQLAELLPAEERLALEQHLATCPHCSALMDQLRGTIAVLRSRPGPDVPDVLQELVADADDARGAALVRHLPQLYSLAVALDPSAADDLVQETISRALADPTADTSDPALAAMLAGLARRRQPASESPPTPTLGDDPDADEPELFYPAFYSDAPDPGGWIDPPVAWGESRVLRPDDDVLTTELFSVVDAALGELDAVDRSLLTLVDIDGVPFSQAALTLDLPGRAARNRLAHARFAVRAALDRYVRG